MNEQELKDTVKELIGMYESVMAYIEWKKLGKDLDTHVNLDYGADFIGNTKEKLNIM